MRSSTSEYTNPNLILVCPLKANKFSQKGAEEIERIKPWLHTIQSRSPNAHVIIVGTHRDTAGLELRLYFRARFLRLRL